MQMGEIKEIGTHKQLLKDKEGVYSKLIERQITGGEIDIWLNVMNWMYVVFYGLFKTWVQY